MGKTLIIYAHPYSDNSVYNKQLLEVSKSLDNVVIHNISTDINNLDIKKEQELLLSADNIIFQFPMIWFNMPYHLIYWMQVVLVDKFAFSYAHKEEEYKLENKKLAAIVTTGSPTTSYQPQGRLGFKEFEALRNLQIISKFIKMSYEGIFAINSKPEGLSQEDKDKYIEFIKSLSK